MLVCGEKAPNRADRMPSPRAARWPDPSRSASLPVGNRTSPSSANVLRSDCVTVTFARTAMSPTPVADPSTKRDVASWGLAAVPPKKCCAVVPPNGMIRASLVPRSEADTIGTTTPMSTLSSNPKLTKNDVTVTSFFVSFGLLDKVDIGVVVPIVSASLRGTSDARIIPFGGTTAQHFFGGTSANPQLSTSRFVDGAATGIGDIAVRAKVTVTQSDRSTFALLGDVRFPTGSEADLLGSGHVAVRGLGVLSARFGAFSPHTNIGYLFQTGDFQNNAVLATVGFDHLMAPWATLAVDVVSQLQVGESKLRLPGPVTYDAPFRRTINVTNLPNERDDQINGSLGFKFLTGSGITLVANTLWPLNHGGLRPNALWTAGLEYNF